MRIGGFVCCVLFCLTFAVAAQQSGTPAPTLSHRPPPAAGPLEGKIKLDVVVTDEAGRPVAGLKQKDFTLLDNKKGRPILSFHAVDGTVGAGRSESPVEVVLLIDVSNTSLKRVAFTRFQVENYLRQNGGHLSQPMSLMLFFDQGMNGRTGVSTDGNLLAEQLDQSQTALHAIHPAGGWDELERFSLSLRALGSIAVAEGKRPGRKMLIWIGPGWPMLDDTAYYPSQTSRRSLFDAMVELSTELREARVTLYSIYPIDPAFDDALRANRYRSFVQGVRSPEQIQPANLALPVLAIQSGGRALDTAGDLSALINSCVQDAAAYYTLSFDPPTIKHADEYHQLKVVIDKAQMQVRTNASYYADPPFQH
jgi:VWFA-related protein